MNTSSILNNGVSHSNNNNNSNNHSLNASHNNFMLPSYETSNYK
jgi:hypothetical protein